MKKVYIFLYVFLLIVLSSFISADLLDDVDFYYSLNETSGTDPKGSVNSSFDGDASSAEWVTGIIANGFDSTSDWISFASHTIAVMEMDVQIISLSGWANFSDTSVEKQLLIDVGSRIEIGVDVGGQCEDNLSALFFDTGYVVICTGITPVLGTWYHLVYTFDSTANEQKFYVNGVLVGETADTDDIVWETARWIGFGGHYTTADTYNLKGTIDEIGIWKNYILNQDNVTALYNNQLALAYPFVPPPPPPPSVTSAPTIVAPSPADNANNNTNVTLNATHSSTLNDVRYYLYFGDTSTLTEGHYQLFNATRTGDEYKTFLTNVSDGIYYYKWKVQNISSGIISANTTQRTWTLDTVTPTITRLTNNNWKIDNSTIISSYLNNLTINISFFDANLYQTLINITNSTDESVYSVLNTSITGTTANYSRIVDISTWAIGNYIIKLEATDTHTAKEISPYDVNTGLNYFRYTTKEGNIIKIKSNNLNLFTKSTTKLKDRYDFEFNYLFQQDTYTFTIESYNKIDYIEDSDYKAHFVIMGSNGRGNWVDFENPYLNKKDYKVTKIDDYIYEIEITANGLKSFTFSSLGGLNVIEKHYLLRLGAVLDIWVYDDETGDGINATATIGSQFAHTIGNTSAARLINISEDITEVTLNATGYGTEEKTISQTLAYHNLSFNMTPVSTVKIYFYDEKSEALIKEETFSVYLETTGFSDTYSADTNPYSVGNLGSGLYKLKASSANYPERQYLDLIVDNITTTNLNIYLINSTLGSEITFNIVDEGLNPLKDVFVVFTKKIGGSDTVIAEENSDFAGQVVLYLDEDTQYTINFTKTNYEDQIINLEPKNSEYVIKMISTVGKYNQSVYEGIRYRFEPSNTVLNNNTKYNFTFTLNSSVWDVTGCALYLKNGSTLLDSTSSFTSNSCFLRIEQDTLDMTNITSEVIYQIGSTYNFTVSQQYSVIYTYEGEFSLKNFLDDLSDFGMAGFDNFGRMMLALIVIFIITSLAAQKIGFTNPEVLIFLVIAQVWLFSYVNWLYLDFTPIPTILGFDLKKYIIAILISLAGGAFVMRKFTD